MLNRCNRVNILIIKYKLHFYTNNSVNGQYIYIIIYIYIYINLLDSLMSVVTYLEKKMYIDKIIV